MKTRLYDATYLLLLPRPGFSYDISFYKYRIHKYLDVCTPLIKFLRSSGDNVNIFAEHSILKRLQWNRLFVVKIFRS